MPVLASRVARSPPAVESPPRKKFKLSLKLKTRKKPKPKNPMDSDSENESGKENADSKMNFESKEALNSSLTKSTNDLTEGNFSTFGLQSEIVTPPLPYTGLANLGNTCYLNAVLQVLRYCPEFLKSLKFLDEKCGQNCTRTTGSTSENVNSSDKDSVASTKQSIIHSVHKLTSAMQNAEENYGMFGLEAKEVKNRSGWTTLAVHPQDFVKDFSGLCPLFGGYQQHDAQEFLRSFLGLVEEECVGLVKGEQQETVKGNMSVACSESKVRGGCKYPSTITNSVAMDTKEEPARAMFTDGSTGIQSNSEVDWNEGPTTPNLRTTTTTKAVAVCKATPPENIVKRLFEGVLLLQTCCLNCEGIRQRHESFQDISVPVQNTKTDAGEERRSNLSDSEDESEHELNLSWAISKFASIERLNGENKYFCDNCATLTEADISTYFEKLPQVLTIHLKRFQTSYGNQNLFSRSWVTKVTKSLHTPQQLSLKKWCSKTCSKKNAVYTLFGVVMHNGMSSCSGHYLSYVNVDVLKKNSDARGKVNAGKCSGTVQREAVGNVEGTMQADDSCMSAIDQLYNTEVPSMNGDQYCRRVKCGSSQSSATQANGLSSHGKDVMKHCKKDVPASPTCKAHDRESNFSHGLCDEKTCETKNKGKDVFLPSQTTDVQEENDDLCCDENLAMDLDDEDTCDYSEVVKDSAKPTSPNTVQTCKRDASDKDTRIESNTKVKSKIPCHPRTDCMKDGHGSDSSSDEDASANFTHIPRSMDITRYFKPIPKSGRSNKDSRRNVEMSSDRNCTSEGSLASSNINSDRASSYQGNQNDSQTTDVDNHSQKLKATSFQVSRCSAFNTLGGKDVSTDTKSDEKSSCGRNVSCSQTTNIANGDKGSTIGFRKSSGNCLSSDVSSDGATNGESNSPELDVRDQSSSCTQKTDNTEDRNDRTRNTDHFFEAGSSPKLKPDTKPGDELSRNDGNPSTDGCIDAGLIQQHSSVADANILNSTRTESANAFTPASDGKSLKCEDSCDAINVEGSKKQTFSSTWLKFDDAEVQEISAKDMDEILSPSSSCYSTPYLLFYYQC